MNTVELAGCAPVPLAHYLKALGILRLVSAQADANAAGCWRRDRFLLTSVLDREGLIDFFLHRCQPTPVLAPWNGGSGFYPKDNQAAITAISSSSSSRLAPYRAGLQSARGAVAKLGLKEKPGVEMKESLLRLCRNTLPEDALGWLDAVLVLGQDGPKYPPLLGTGGNDGRLEFTNNFMQRLLEVIDPASGEPAPHAARWLRAALEGSSEMAATAPAPVGQFFPGAAGGANGTSGFDSPSAINPWDFILMIEGAMLFAAAAVKRLESAGGETLVYPFCVRQTGVGYASAATVDENDARCEMWLPLWDQPATLAELGATFGEGRAQVNGRSARHGVDFARAVVSLGVDRGIAAFQRYGFQVRNGLSYFATPLDRVVVRRYVGADSLADIDPWLDRLRQKAGPQANPDPPASVARGLNGVERAILELCRDGSPDAVQALLIALGQAERALAKSLKWSTNNYVHPLYGLRSQWLAGNESPEFRLAVSLAGMRASFGKGKGTLWFRQHLEPVEIGSNGERSWVDWDKTPSNDVVWHEGLLEDALNAILARRVLRVAQAGVNGWPDWSPRYARLGDVAAFIENRTDDGLLADLIWSLSLVDGEKIGGDTVEADDADGNVPSSFYALLKLCFRRSEKNEHAIPLVPAIHHRARSGDGLAASQLAARRLRGSGYAPLVGELPVAAQVARRTAAALLFPISPRDLSRLEQTILRQPENQNI